MYCKHCNSPMIGDGFNSVLRCELAEPEDYDSCEADANPVYCKHEERYAIINFIGKDANYTELVAYICQGFDYEQVKELFITKGVYIPLDQFKAIETVINIQLNLDIGNRTNERNI